MRNLHKCPILYEIYKEGIDCSFPNEPFCQRIKGSLLCQHRVKEIGMKNCLIEVREWENLKHLKK